MSTFSKEESSRQSSRLRSSSINQLFSEDVRMSIMATGFGGAGAALIMEETMPPLF
jgi:hypothetical protein